MEPEVTQEITGFADFMETFVEPTYALIYYFAINVAPAVAALVNFMTSVTEFLYEIGGLWVGN